MVAFGSFYHSRERLAREEDTILHKKLRALREERGMEQKDVARALGVNPSAVTRWESGEKRPELNNLVRLADLFGVSVDYILGRTEVRKPAEAG